MNNPIKVQFGGYEVQLSNNDELKNFILCHLKTASEVFHDPAIVAELDELCRSNSDSRLLYLFGVINTLSLAIDHLTLEDAWQAANQKVFKQLQSQKEGRKCH